MIVDGRGLTRVLLTFHLEAGAEESVWWAESPDVPGFFATAESLVETRILSERTVAELLPADLDIEFDYELHEDPPARSTTEVVVEGLDQSSIAA